MTQMDKEDANVFPGQTLLQPAWPSAYLLALLLVLAATLTSAASLWLIGPRAVPWPFVIALVLIGSRFGRRPAMMAAVAAYLAYNFLSGQASFRLHDRARGFRRASNLFRRRFDRRHDGRPVE